MTRSTALPFAAAALLLPALVLRAAPSPEEIPDDPVRLYGDSLRLGAGMIRSWVEVNGAGEPTAVGVTLPDVVLASPGHHDAMLSLDFPPVEGLPFRHVLFDWAPGGHPPGHLYGHPHWDAHFYLIPASERKAIQEGEQPQPPDPRYLPEGFIPVPDLGLYAFPSMGVHWMHREARELHGHTFDETLIYGTDGGRVIFVEPMFTNAFLERRPDFSAPVPWPAAVQAPGWYPGRYVIRYEEAAAAFRISLEDFRWRDAG